MTFDEYRKRYGIKLNEQQEKAVLRAKGNTLLLAVPGSGKTTVIVSRLGYMINCLGISYDSILTLTYSVAACRDMKERYISFFGRDNVPQFRTIHGICALIIREYERVKSTSAFSLIGGEDSENGLLTEVYIKLTGKYPEQGEISEIKKNITYIRNMMLTKNEIIQLGNNINEYTVSIMEGYECEKRARRLMDYDDQLTFALTILRRCPDILGGFRRRYRFVNVDEAQDTSKLQHEIIGMLADGNLFMVGDEDQSIYGFRAAYPRALLDFDKRYKDAAVLFMEQNFRSTGRIVARASKLIENNCDRRKKHMFTTAGAGRDIETVSFPKRSDQYEWLCSEAKEVPKKDETSAVLFRNNDSALPIIDMLESCCVPYRYREADCPFFDNAGISDILALLDVVYENSAKSFEKVARKLGCGLSGRDVANILGYAEKAKAGFAASILKCITEDDERFERTAELCAAMVRASRLCVQDSIYLLCQYTCFGRFLELRMRDKGQKTAILLELAKNCRSKAAFDRKLGKLRDITQKGTSPDGNAMILSTVHSSKGLEYDNVIIIDLKDGEFPGMDCPERCSADMMPELEEERRLFYVAVTRARKTVRITQYAADLDGSTGHGSMFLRELMRYDIQAVPIPQSKSKNSASADISLFREGTRVNHKKYGAGTVQNVVADKIAVSFDCGTVKQFSLSVATGSGFLELSDGT